MNDLPSGRPFHVGPTKGVTEMGIGFWLVVDMFALAGAGYGAHLCRKTSCTWPAKATTVGGLAFAGGLLGAILAVAVGLALLVPPWYNWHKVTVLEKMPGYQYYVESQSESLEATITYYDGTSIKNLSPGTVAYDAGSSSVPRLVERTSTPRAFQRFIWGAMYDKTVTNTFHVPDIAEEGIWFETVHEEVVGLDRQIASIEPEKPANLKGFAPSALVMGAEQSNYSQIWRLAVRRDIQAANYNKQSSVLDETGFHSSGTPWTSNLPYQIPLKYQQYYVRPAAAPK